MVYMICHVINLLLGNWEVIPSGIHSINSVMPCKPYRAFTVIRLREQTECRCGYTNSYNTHCVPFSLGVPE